MRVPVRAETLRRGDYLQVAFERWTPHGMRPGEQYARIEHVEHLAQPAFLEPVAQGLAARISRTVAAVFCQGMPGPVLLRGGDQHVARSIDPLRRQWDQLHATWPEITTPFFEGAVPADKPHRSRPVISGPADAESSPPPVGRPRRAASFTKPAGDVMAGDYLCIQDRWPEEDRDVDEGFHRVEWVEHLGPDHLPHLLHQPGWADGRVTLLTVWGLGGTLVLPERPVRVLTAPNIERVRHDTDTSWKGGPFYGITGATCPDQTDQQAKDAARRPSAPDDEAGLYPSRFPDEASRALHLEGQQGIRLVPTSVLPWPHRLFR
ncbi:hypothetical protein [Streptomyces sp. NPDC002187]|uniref:hypothetical protein n=1 Tax=Streptomyces sp. NPDC002187 TaxID=3364637 RepID=UPI003699A75F